MLETNPTTALLGVAASGKGAAKGAGKNGDDSAFSREFEQLARSSEAQHSASDSASGNEATAEDVGTRESDATADPDETGKSEQAATANEEAGIMQGQLAAGGNDLPPVAVTESSDQITGKEENKEPSADGGVESAGEIAQLVAQQLEPKQAANAATGEIRQNIAQSLTTGGYEAKSEAKVVATLPGLHQDDSDLSGITSNGKDNGQARARQGKGDNALFTLVAGSNRGANAFTESLNSAGAGTVVANTPTHQPLSAASVQLSIATQPQQQGWDNAMGERVVWLARNNIQHAHIQLNPRELGPIEIKVSVHNDQAHVNFVAHHATTRESIEAAIPRLREMMTEQGLNLGQADVSQHSFGDGRQQSAVADNSSGGNSAHHGLPEDGDVDGAETILHNSMVSSSAVDYFA